MHDGLQVEQRRFEQTIDYNEVEVPRLGHFELIPEAWHRPLRQRMVLMKNALPAAVAFHDYLSTPAAQAIMQRYGFAMPKD